MKKLTTMFPIIIREFDDGSDEKPMIYGEQYDWWFFGKMW